MTNNTNQSLQDIILSLPSSFIDMVFKAPLDDLLKLQKTTKCEDKGAVIAARIEKINYLSV